MTVISARPGWRQGEYGLVAASATAHSEWESFADQEPAAAKKAFERLTTAPLSRQPKRQFPLRGKALKPFWEYEATSADRIWYGVNLSALTVVVAARRDGHSGGKVANLITSRRAGFDQLLDETRVARAKKKRVT